MWLTVHNHAYPKKHICRSRRVPGHSIVCTCKACRRRIRINKILDKLKVTCKPKKHQKLKDDITNRHIKI